ncbi:hypothetical protein NQZ68_029025 [Dissostichus eleginoides]|nr:hypothetical protein NQZ68_029025 [Dissostichus eleginoides]
MLSTAAVMLLRERGLQGLESNQRGHLNSLRPAALRGIQIGLTQVEVGSAHRRGQINEGCSDTQKANLTGKEFGCTATGGGGM